MLTVDVFEIDMGVHKKVGTISTDGKRILISPSDEPLLKGIASDPIDVPQHFDPTSDPTGFVRNLHRQYRSPYLNVSDAREV